MKPSSRCHLELNIFQRTPGEHPPQAARSKRCQQLPQAKTELGKSSIAIRGAMIDEVKAVDTQGVESWPFWKVETGETGESTSNWWNRWKHQFSWFWATGVLVLDGLRLVLGVWLRLRVILNAFDCSLTVDDGLSLWCFQGGFYDALTCDFNGMVGFSSTETISKHNLYKETSKRQLPRGLAAPKLPSSYQSSFAE